MTCASSCQRAGTALTALVERFAKLHPPEDLALLRVAQVAVKAVPQPLTIEHLARLRWKRGVRVAGAVLSGLFQATLVRRSTLSALDRPGYKQEDAQSGTRRA